MRYNVLNKGFVEVQFATENGDLRIVNAARTSFLGESKGEEKDKKLLEYLYKNKHHTPFEMCNLQVLVKAPLLVWGHWFRHRTFSYNSQSYRYTEIQDDDFYIPDVWRKQSVNNKQASDGTFSEEVSQSFNQMFQEHINNSMDIYNSLNELGVAKEMSRLFIPSYAAYSTVLVSGNLRNWLHFINLRNKPEAQFETSEYAKVIEKIIEDRFPWTYEFFIKYSVDI